MVSSNAPHTHGIWEGEDGLPTVERLRDLPIDLQTRLILATGEVDDILIGNAYATEAELKAVFEVFLLVVNLLIDLECCCRGLLRFYFCFQEYGHNGVRGIRVGGEVRLFVRLSCNIRRRDFPICWCFLF